MNGRRQSLTAPGGGGGGGGGGSRRILAATITYTGSPTTRPNQVTGTVTGTLPDPATVLPGGVLQSIQYWVANQVDFNISLAYQSLGVLNDAVIPFYFRIDGIEYLATRSVLISASSTGQSATGTNIAFSRIVERDASGSTFPSTPTISLRIGEPNYGLQTGLGSVAQNITYNSLQLDGSMKVYYLFE